MTTNQSPRDVAERLFAALQRQDWRAAVAEWDVDELARFRDREIGRLAMARQFEASPPAGSGGMVVDDDMIAQALDQAGGTAIRGFSTANDLAGVASLPAGAFFGEYLEALDQVFAEVSAPRVIVGVVAEGDALAHVLYRRDDAGRRRPARLRRGSPSPAWMVDVLALRRRDGAWKAILNREIASERLDFIQAYLAPETPE